MINVVESGCVEGGWLACERGDKAFTEVRVSSALDRDAAFAELIAFLRASGFTVRTAGQSVQFYAAIGAGGVSGQASIATGGGEVDYLLRLDE